MKAVDRAADAIIQQIDAGTLHTTGNIVARALLRKIGARHEIIARYDRGETAPPIEIERLWAQIEALPLDQQGALRLVAGLARADEELDWYGAEFFIDWARQQGVPEEDIVNAFCRRE